MFLQGPGVDRSLLQLQPLLNARHLDFWLNLASFLNHNFVFTRKKTKSLTAGEHKHTDLLLNAASSKSSSRLCHSWWLGTISFEGQL